MNTSANPSHYDVLQISPNAEQVVITKVYRLLAAFYHPDNKQTGNEEKFKQVLKSYEVLSDPAKRSRYNLELSGSTGKSARPSTQNSSKLAPASNLEPLGSRSATFEAALRGMEDQISEREIRKLILFALYDVRRNTPNIPELSLLVLAELLSCAVHDLEFSTWYLKEKGLIKVSESADYSITIAGVDHVEKEYLEPEGRKYPLSLPAPRN
jgi:hypothetical protein